MKYLRGWWLPIAGIICIVSGVWIGLFGFPKWSNPAIAYEKVQEIKAADANFPVFTTYFPADSLAKYLVHQGENATLSLDAVQYRANDGGTRQAIVYLPDNSVAQPTQEIKKLRHDLWAEAMLAVTQNTDEKTLFLSWWDNSQRIDLLSGRLTWARAPIAAAFAGNGEQKLWQQIADPFAKDEAPLRVLAKWLAMDAQQALKEMTGTLPANIPVYLLACADDLARVNEIERLSGKKLGFEARIFPQSGDMHSQIAEVKRWASETGSGSYLVQTIPGQGIRAWRITDSETENTLLAKMLPFTSSLAKPLENLEAVYQSSWGAYLTIYHWRRDAAPPH